MARPLRFEYPGAVYHVMARGDGGKFIFKEKDDCLLFLDWLSRVCESHGWRVHAWVIMGNHFHLLRETPEPNLVSGMKVLLGAYAQAWNRRHQRQGHVFQGRHKSIPVSGELASGSCQFRVVADYIHLNPARAKLAGGAKGKLVDYQWSSLAAYQKGRGPAWLQFERVLQSFQLSKDGRGRRAYVEYLEKRASERKGKLSEESMKALRRGWYLGDDSFRDQLLNLVERRAKALRTKGSHSGGELKGYDEVEAERIVSGGLDILEISDDEAELRAMRKGDSRKVALAIVVKARTSVGNEWIAQRLKMGHNRSVSRWIKNGREDKKTMKISRRIEKCYHARTDPYPASVGE